MHKLRPIRPGTLTLEEAFFFYPHIQQGDCLIWDSTINAGGYGVLFWQKKQYKAHRLAYLFGYGVDPGAQRVDHICRNRACVNPDHLRLVTDKQNSENRSAVGSGSSGVRGVSHTKSGRWEARTRHNGVDYRFGTFSTVEEAAEAARLGRCQLHTHNDIDRTAQCLTVSS